MRKNMRNVVISILMLCLVAGSVFAAGQTEPATDSWSPTKPVTIICPYGAGGGQDVSARIFAKYAEKYSSQKFVVDNRAGGSGAIGNTAIMTARPDGYTLGMYHSLSNYDQFLVEGVKYTEKSFIQLAAFAADATVIVVNKNLGVSNISELVELARKQPGRITWGGPEFSAQTYPRINVENATGVKFSKMIFDGGAKALVAVAGDNCNVTSVFPSEFAAMSDNPNLVAIAACGAERIPAFPDIPTMIEQGVNASFYQSRSIVAPLGLPEEIVAYYDDLFIKVVEDADFQDEMTRSGFNYIKIAGHEAATKYMLQIFEENKDSVIAAAK